MSITLREGISKVKKELKLVNSDYSASNKFIYSKILSTSSLFIQRESDALRLTNLAGVYQSLKCVEVKEVPSVDKNCFVSSKYVMYRTKGKLPDLYVDASGPLIKAIRSVDRTTDINYTTQNAINRTLGDTSNSKYDKSVYAFYEEGYLYLTKKIPIIVEGAFVTDVSTWCGCECEDDDKPCKPFLDNRWFIPTKLVEPVIKSVISDLVNGYIKIPNQKVTDKDTST